MRIDVRRFVTLVVAMAIAGSFGMSSTSVLASSGGNGTTSDVTNGGTNPSGPSQSATWTSAQSQIYANKLQGLSRVSAAFGTPASHAYVPLGLSQGSVKTLLCPQTTSTLCGPPTSASVPDYNTNEPNGYYGYQWPVLERLGVAELFEAVITPDVAGYEKPDPRIFGLVPGLIAHVGDLLLHDVLGANLAGLQSIWLDAELPEHLSQLPPIERVREQEFTEYLRRTLTASRYRQFHPEATLETCTPTAVVRDVDEAATVVLESISAWTPASN